MVLGSVFFCMGEVVLCVRMRLLDMNLVRKNDRRLLVVAMIFEKD